MSEMKCGSLILDAIDQLRKRKARPDLDRICHMLERRHGLKSAAVNEQLSKLVKEGVVVKVDYKGNTSYRNAAKWVRTKTQFFGSFYNTSDISTVVLEAIAALTIPSQDPIELKSASIHDIEQYLLKRDAQSNLNLATLRTVLEKEVARKSIQQLPSGEFVPLKQNGADLSTPEKSSESFTKRADSPPIKHVKSEAEGSPTENSNHDSQVNRCDYCLLTASTNRKGVSESLLMCKDCNAKAHPSCMEMSLDGFTYPHEWQCPDCRTCAVCNDPENPDIRLTCCMCLRDYHLNCHEPAIVNKPAGAWYCSECDSKRFKFSRSYSKYSSNISEERGFNDEAAVTPQRKAFRKSIEKYPSNVPLAQNWTIDNVEEFFAYIGFAEEAQVFREQEIDGLSLLLMKRDDVLIGLGIKLGPALKIYKHIQKLQCKVGETKKI